MRLAYLGTPEVAVPPLLALSDAGHDIALVVTGPDRRRGRGGRVSPSPVKAAAEQLGLAVSHDVDDVLSVGAELGIVVAFGQIIRPHVLAELQMINLHFSILPRWRGAAPVERAILAGDRETGVAVMGVEEGLDTGPIYAEAIVPISDRATTESLRAELVAVGSELLVASLADGLGAGREQSGEPVYAHKLAVEDFRIDWGAPAVEIDRLIRVGRAWTTFRGDRIKILDSEVIEGELVPITVQPAGKGPMSYGDWRNGTQPGPRERFE